MGTSHVFENLPCAPALCVGTQAILIYSYEVSTITYIVIYVTY